MYTLTGIGVYVQGIVNNCSVLNSELEWHFPIFCELPFGFVLEWALKRHLTEQAMRRLRITAGFAVFHNQRHARESRQPTHLLKGSVELFHITNTQSQFDVFELPYVITVHDLAWMRVPRTEMPTPQVFGLEKLEALIRNANHVICDSECTRTDVLEFIGRKPEDVSTILLAPRPFFHPRKAEQAISGNKRSSAAAPFFLAISTIEPRKNYVRLITAFAAFQKQRPDFRLVIAGAKRSAWPDVRLAIRKLGLEKQVHVIGRVSDERVRELLWDATALVYPSLYEGFGLPALEAMASGTPVVCSAAGSLGEVVGDAAIIVDPLNVDSIVDGMRQVADLDTRREVFVQRSIEHAAKFSWKTTASKTLDVYRQVLQV